MYAIKNNNYDIFIYIHENNLPVPKNICIMIANNGNIKFLEYAHQNKFYWNEETTQKLIENGHLECLKYAHKNKCPWNTEYICGFAILNHKYDCLKYCHRNGGKLNAYIYYLAKNTKKNKEKNLCLEYLEKHKCPENF
jgi:hypothetical protein